VVSVQSTFDNISLLVTVPTFDPKHAIAPCDEEKKVVNFSQVAAAFCLDKIVQQSDLMAMQERIKSNHQEGLTYKERLQQIKAFTAGQVFRAKGCRVGKDIRDIYLDRSADEKCEGNIKHWQGQETYSKIQEEVKALLLSNVELANMTVKQLLILLCPLKRKENGATPILKKMMLEKYGQWKDLLRLIFEDLTDGKMVEEEGGDAVEVEEVREDE